MLKHTLREDVDGLPPIVFFCQFLQNLKSIVDALKHGCVVVFELLGECSHRLLNSIKLGMQALRDRTNVGLISVLGPGDKALKCRIEVRMYVCDLSECHVDIARAVAFGCHAVVVVVSLSFGAAGPGPWLLSPWSFWRWHESVSSKFRPPSKDLGVL